jgi:hypothetical protein
LHNSIPAREWTVRRLKLFNRIPQTRRRGRDSNGRKGERSINGGERAGRLCQELHEALEGVFEARQRLDGRESFENYG